MAGPSGPRFASPAVPTAAPSLLRDLYLRLAALRRVSLFAGIAVAFVFTWTVETGHWKLAPLLVVVGVGIYNEIGRLLLRRLDGRWLAAFANIQVALDTLALIFLLNVYGADTDARVAVLGPAFVAYGSVLSLRAARMHAMLATLELAFLGTSDRALALATLGNLVSLHLAHFLTSLPRSQGALRLKADREAQRVKALLEVAQHTSAARSVDQLLRATCESAVAFLHLPRIEILLWDPDEERLLPAAYRGTRGDMPGGDSLGDPSLVASLRDGEPVRLDGTETACHAFAVPMTCGGWFEGALLVRADDEVTDDLVDLVQGMARQTALALVHVRTMEQRQEDAQVSRTLLGLSEAVSACLDEEVLWNLLVRSAGKALDLEWSLGVRYDESKGTFRVVSAKGLPEGVSTPADQLRPDDYPVLADLLQRRQIIAAGESHLSPLLLGRVVGSWIAIPLCRGSWMAGVLVVGLGDQHRVFSKGEMRVAEGLAHHASIALQNARLFAELENADRVKSEFVSTVSHELRTPLNVIIGYTEMLREGAVGELTGDQRDLVVRLDRRGRELLDLVEATLQVNRLEAGSDQVNTTPISLAELMQALDVSTAGLPRPPDVSFEWRVPQSAGVMVRTERARLALVVRNLVGNAFKFTSTGKVEVRLLISDDVLTIEVEDTGMGIPTDQIPIIFDMFRQVDGSETRRHNGVGLGLYIVKQFVARLGGHIEVTSVLGSGSTFRVTFPGAVIAGGERAAA
jgi:signal transduction histidine kinase